MNAHEVLESSLKMADSICLSYVNDLSDAELMTRACPAINHVNWQLGHLIVSEHEIMDASLPGSMPPLPEGFALRYDRANATCDDPQAFATKEELLKIQQQQRLGTLAALKKMSTSDLDQPAPEQFRSYAPTLGEIVGMQGSHWLMHCGQWAVVRRQLGRPPLF